MAADNGGIIEDIYHTSLTLGFELLKHIRRKRFYIILAVSLMFSLLYFVVGKASNISWPSEANEFAQINLSSINFFIIISASVFAGDAINGEFEKKTGLLLFPTPQERTSIFIGKYLAALFAVYTFISLSYFVTMLEIANLYGFGEVSTEFMQSYLLALLYAASVTAIIFTFSSIMKSTTSSSLVGFFFLFLILPIITSISIVLNADPWYSISYSGYLMIDILDKGSYDLDLDLSVGITVMFAYAIILVLTSLFIANRRQME